MMLLIEWLLILSLVGAVGAFALSRLRSPSRELGEPRPASLQELEERTLLLLRRLDELERRIDMVESGKNAQALQKLAEIERRLEQQQKQRQRPEPPAQPTER